MSKKEDSLFIQILAIIEAYGEGDSKIKYPTPLARILTETVRNHYGNKIKWWQFWKRFG